MCGPISMWWPSMECMACAPPSESIAEMSFVSCLADIFDMSCPDMSIPGCGRGGFWAHVVQAIRTTADTIVAIRIPIELPHFIVTFYKHRRRAIVAERRGLSEQSLRRAGTPALYPV